VFLGEDLMHTRDYSEDTSKIIDDEVERILRAQEQRATDVLSKHRGGLNAIARALLDNEIIDGAEVARLVDEAHGSPVHGDGAKAVPHFSEAAITANGHGNGSGSDDAADPVAVPAAPTTPATQANPAGPPESAHWPPPAWPPAGEPPTPGPGSQEGPTTP
jgi:cell division protease FtsH